MQEWHPSLNKKKNKKQREGEYPLTTLGGKLEKVNVGERKKERREPRLRIKKALFNWTDRRGRGTYGR